MRRGNSARWPSDEQRAEMYAGLFGDRFATLALDLRQAFLRRLVDPATPRLWMAGGALET